MACMVWFVVCGGGEVKAISCLSYVMMGGVNLIYALKAEAGKKYAAVMFAGFVFAWLGDVLLGVNFVLGAGLFALGHVLYAAAFYMLYPFRKQDLLVSGAFLAGALALLLCYPKFDFGGALMQGVCMAYALIISCMTGKAVSNSLKKKDGQTIIAAAGSALFFFSDVMLVLRYFVGAPWIADRLCLLTYFPGQMLLAASVYYYVKQKER